jgi:hypothetical protein
MYKRRVHLKKQYVASQMTMGAVTRNQILIHL